MLTDIEKVIREAEAQRLYGQIQLDYQDGRLVLIRKTETIRPTHSNAPQGKTHANTYIRD